MLIVHRSTTSHSHSHLQPSNDTEVTPKKTPTPRKATPAPAPASTADDDGRRQRHLASARPWPLPTKRTLRSHPRRPQHPASERQRLTRTVAAPKSKADDGTDAEVTPRKARGHASPKGALQLEYRMDQWSNSRYLLIQLLTLSLTECKVH